MRWVVLAALAAVAGCAQSEVIILRDPATGQITRCEKNSGPSFFPIAQTMIDNSAARSCAAGYEAAGWQRMNPP